MTIDFEYDDFEELLRSLHEIRAMQLAAKLPSEKISVLIKRLKDHRIKKLSTHSHQLMSKGAAGQMGRFDESEGSTTRSSSNEFSHKHSHPL